MYSYIYNNIHWLICIYTGRLIYILYYAPIRTDRVRKLWGGLLICTKLSITLTDLTKPTNINTRNTELQMIRAHTSNHRHRVSNLYLPTRLRNIRNRHTTHHRHTKFHAHRWCEHDIISESSTYYNNTTGNNKHFQSTWKHTVNTTSFSKQTNTTLKKQDVTWTHQTKDQTQRHHTYQNKHDPKLSEMNYEITSFI